MTDPADHRTNFIQQQAGRIFRRQSKYFRRLAADKRAARERKDGSAGAAGPCKRIDPVTMQVIEIIEVTR